MLEFSKFLGNPVSPSKLPCSESAIEGLGGGFGPDRCPGSETPGIEIDKLEAGTATSLK